MNFPTNHRAKKIGPREKQTHRSHVEFSEEEAALLEGDGGSRFFFIENVSKGKITKF